MATIVLPNTFTSGTTIQSAQVNSDLTTIYNDYNGNITNANIAAGAAIGNAKLNLALIAQIIAMSGQPINFAKGADIASAATVNIGAATGNSLDITGTTTITAFDTVQAGTIRFVRFTGALTLTHNATSLILPGAVNITTIANDTATFWSLGSGNWVCLNYQKGWSPANFPIEGYATGRNIIRGTSLTIVAGGTPGTNINVTAGSLFNNPTVSNATNLAKSGTSGSFSLSADGITLTMNITENIVGLLGAYIVTHVVKNASTVAGDIYFVGHNIVSSNMTVTFTKSAVGSGQDITTILTTAGDTLIVNFVYLTST